jgi:hypothetical protein
VVVDVLDVERVLLNVAAAFLDFLAHEHAEQRLGRRPVLHVNAHQRTTLRVERGVPQLNAVHLAQTLEACDRQALLAGLADVTDQLA